MQYNELHINYFKTEFIHNRMLDKKLSSSDTDV